MCQSDISLPVQLCVECSVEDVSDFAAVRIKAVSGSEVVSAESDAEVFHIQL